MLYSSTVLATLALGASIANAELIFLGAPPVSTYNDKRRQFITAVENDDPHNSLHVAVFHSSDLWSGSPVEGSTDIFESKEEEWFSPPIEW
mmetsp:Transcript_33847/g.70355  ORF Transcript_33847/g.70355 Transcript_33847/m.70355 type:complete len:91 (-) Transcript_33847:1550-1822(-)